MNESNDITISEEEPVVEQECVLQEARAYESQGKERIRDGMSVFDLNFFAATIFSMRNSKGTVSNCWNRPGIARTAADCT